MPGDAKTKKKSIASANVVLLDDTARFFAERKAKAKLKAFDKLMRRRGGVPPRKGDEIQL